MKITTFVLCALGLALAQPAAATIIALTASMDCDQAGTCGAGGSGTGSVTMLYDDVSMKLTWDIDWSGLSGTYTVSHFHGPAAPGVNAGVVVPILGMGPGVADLTAAQAADMLDGLWYVNVHTDRFPPGEIRGQVQRVPEPGVVALFGIGLVGLAIARRRRRSP